MALVIGTTEGLFTADGDPILEDVPIVHAATNRDGRWVADDEGRAWKGEEVVAEAPEGARWNCLAPTPDGVWLGADSARLFFLGEDGLVEDTRFAQAPGRDRWTTPWGGPPDVRSIAVAPDGVLYVNVHVGGIIRYGEAELTPTVDISADVHQVVAHPERKGMVAAATAWGLAVSEDGHRFDFRTEGLARHYCRALAVHRDKVLISSSSGSRGQNARLHRGSLTGGELVECLDGLPEEFDGNIDTHCVAAGDEGMFVGNGSGVWRSDDGGKTWEQLLADLPRITCLAL